jgi:hypothetical protein
MSVEWHIGIIPNPDKPEPNGLESRIFITASQRSVENRLSYFCLKRKFDVVKGKIRRGRLKSPILSLRTK